MSATATSAPNFRTWAAAAPPYYCFNREERQLAAILFHALCLPGRGNVEKLLKSVRCDWPINPIEFGVYFEFSYPRDLWHASSKNDNTNEIKRKLIVESLRENSFENDLADGLTKLGIHEFNSKFVHGRVSNRFIQSPANWQLPVFLKWLSRPEDIAAVCKLKWAFKAKPDIVVQPDRHHALCLELKLESGEGSYPAVGIEKKALRELGLFAEGKVRPFPMSQTLIQRFLMEKLLGFDTRFVFITRRKKHYTPFSSEIDATSVSWDMLLAALDLLGLPPFMDATLQHARTVDLVKTEEAPDNAEDPE